MNIRAVIEALVAANPATAIRLRHFGSDMAVSPRRHRIQVLATNQPIVNQNVPEVRPESRNIRMPSAGSNLRLLTKCMQDFFPQTSALAVRIELRHGELYYS